MYIVSSLFVISISCCFNMVSVRRNGLWYKHVLALCAFLTRALLKGLTLTICVLMFVYKCMFCLVYLYADRFCGFDFGKGLQIGM